MSKTIKNVSVQAVKKAAYVAPAKSHLDRQLTARKAYAVMPDGTVYMAR